MTVIADVQGYLLFKSLLPQPGPSVYNPFLFSLFVRDVLSDEQEKCHEIV